MRLGVWEGGVVGGDRGWSAGGPFHFSFHCLLYGDSLSTFVSYHLLTCSHAPHAPHACTHACAGIARLVSDAQAREAPVQRLADAVAGRFCLGVMAAAAATFLFWLGAGAALWPHVLDGVGSWAELEASYHSHGGTVGRGGGIGDRVRAWGAGCGVAIYDQTE